MLLFQHIFIHGFQSNWTSDLDTLINARLFPSLTAHPTTSNVLTEFTYSVGWFEFIGTLYNF